MPLEAPVITIPARPVEAAAPVPVSTPMAASLPDEGSDGTTTVPGTKQFLSRVNGPNPFLRNRLLKQRGRFSLSGDGISGHLTETRARVRFSE